MGIKGEKKHHVVATIIPCFRVVFRAGKSMAQEATGKRKKKRKASFAYNEKVNGNKNTKQENTTWERAKAESKVQTRFTETSEN